MLIVSDVNYRIFNNVIYGDRLYHVMDTEDLSSETVSGADLKKFYKMGIMFENLGYVIQGLLSMNTLFRQGCFVELGSARAYIKCDSWCFHVHVCGFYFKIPLKTWGNVGIRFGDDSFTLNYVNTLDPVSVLDNRVDLEFKYERNNGIVRCKGMHYDGISCTKSEFLRKMVMA